MGASSALSVGRGADVVIESAGAKEAWITAFEAVRKGGRILTVGNTGGARFEIDNRFIFGKHLSLIGSTMGTHSDFAAVMELVKIMKI